MEPRFGHDFSQVRVHTGTDANQSAEEVNAHAYTVGHDIVFGAGRFAPGTQEGQRLLAHELTHVVQQFHEGGGRFRQGDDNRASSTMHSVQAIDMRSATSLQRKPSVTDVCEVLEPGGTCNVEELDTSPPSFDFGRVGVGQIKQVTIAVKNPDPSNTIAIDSAHAINNGFGDFEVYGIDAVLPPGATANVTIGFRPTVAGARGGTIKVAGDNGAEVGYIQVRGEGTETGEHLETRVKSQDAAIDAARAKSPAPSHFQQRSVAEAEVNKWYDGVENLTEKTAFYASVNWTRFLAETGGDFSVAWTEGQFINAVGAVGSGLVGLLPGGQAVDFVLSVLFSLIYGGIFTAKGNKENEETVNEKLKTTGHASEDQQRRFEHQKDTALGHARVLKSTALSRIWSANDVDEIDEVRGWAQREIGSSRPAPKTDDLTMYKNLLHDWVLERAGDARNAGRDTNRPAYKAARESAFGLRGNAALARNDLFIYQARHEWSLLSLSGITEETDLRANVSKYELQGRGAGITGADLTQFVLNTLGEEVWQFFWVKDPEQTAHVLQQVDVNIRADEIRDRRLGCQMWLERDGSSIVVRKYAYYLDGYIGERKPK
ncbi:MAG: hypothetical protein QOK37_3624 [Thermoanaerobaculia bacterium]|nr:hypothetical protein [Thermoanaerobaculia bacterium]